MAKTAVTKQPTSNLSGRALAGGNGAGKRARETGAPARNDRARTGRRPITTRRSPGSSRRSAPPQPETTASASRPQPGHPRPPRIRLQPTRRSQRRARGRADPRRARSSAARAGSHSARLWARCAGLLARIRRLGQRSRCRSHATDGRNGCPRSRRGGSRRSLEANGARNRGAPAQRRVYLRSSKLINTMVDQLNAFASEVTRVAREVGSEGKLGGQAEVRGVAGTWKDLTDSVNFMARQPDRAGPQHRRTSPPPSPTAT